MPGEREGSLRLGRAGGSCARGALLGAAVLAVAGCCLSGSAPPAAKYFERSTPMDAVKGFVYSVEIGDWDYAFESLTEGSRERVESPTRLMLAVNLIKDPDFGVIAREVLTEAIRRRKLLSADPVRGEALVRLRYVAESGGTLRAITIPVRLYLEPPPGGEGGRLEWHVDLVGTLEELYGPMPAPGA